MALNLDAMRQKLASVTGADKKQRNNFWRPQDGESNIRILPTADGDPFKDKWFHYNVGQAGFLCPKRNFGDSCPVCDFASQLWNEGTEDSKKMAKNFMAKQRFFSPVLVRGEEAEGVKVWGYGKMAYESLLNIVLDPDYGDITDPDEGNDLKLTYGKPAGASFPRTDIRPRPKKTIFCDESENGEDKCAELLEAIPDFDSLFERKTTEEVQAILDQHISAETEDVEKYGDNSDNKVVDAVEQSFNELLGG